MSDEKSRVTNEERQEAYEHGKVDGQTGVDNNPYEQSFLKETFDYDYKQGELNRYYEKGRSDGKSSK